MKKQTLLIFFLVLGSVLATAQVRLAIKPIDFQGKNFVTSCSGEGGFYALFQNELPDKKIRYVVKQWNGGFWRTYSSLVLDSMSHIHSMVFDEQKRLHVVGNFEFNFNGDMHRNVMYNEAGVWKSYEKAMVFRKGDFIKQALIHKNKLLLVGKFDSLGNTEYNNMAYVKLNAFEPFVDSNDNVGLKGRISKVLVDSKEELYVVGNIEIPGTGLNQGITVNKNGKWLGLGKDFEQVENIAVTNEDHIFVYGKELGQDFKFYSFNKIIQIWTEQMQGISNVDIVNNMVMYDSTLFVSGLFTDNVLNQDHSLIAFKGNRWNLINNSFGCKFLDTASNEIYFINVDTVSNPYIHSIYKPFISSFKIGQKSIFGRLFLDLNKNCELDNGDRFLSRTGIKFLDNVQPVFTNDSGHFVYFFSGSSIKKPSLFSFQTNFDYKLCIPDSLLFDGELNGFIGPIEIAVVPDVSTKAKINRRLTLQKGSRVQQGGRNMMVYSIQNIGLTDADSVQMIFSGSNKLKNFVSNPPLQIINDSLVGWSFNKLVPLEERKIVFSYAIQDNVDVIDNTFQFMLNLDYFDGSESQTESDEFSQSVVEYDSEAYKEQFLNKNLLSTQAVISEKDTTIEYQITFQNRMSEVVNEVVIVDTLDLTLDFKYTQELSSSHYYTTQVVSDPILANRGYLIWTFPNINLIPNPDSNPELVTDAGFIRFKFVFKTLEQGEVVRNRALVIMNGSEMIATNLVECTVDENISVPSITNVKDLFVYPNPAQSTLYLGGSFVNGQNFEYTLHNSMGMLLTKSSTTSAQIPLSNLSSGVYFIQLQSEGQVFRFKFLVEGNK